MERTKEETLVVFIMQEVSLSPSISFPFFIKKLFSGFL